MNEPSNDDTDLNAPAPQFHLMGFVDSSNAVRLVESTLRRLNIADDRLSIYSPGHDREAFQEMMYSSLWGEAAEQFLQQGLKEMDAGHFVIALRTHDEDDARALLAELTPTGIHGVTHFGSLVDTQFTA